MKMGIFMSSCPAWGVLSSVNFQYSKITAGVQVRELRADISQFLKKRQIESKVPRPTNLELTDPNTRKRQQTLDRLRVWFRDLECGQQCDIM